MEEAGIKMDCLIAEKVFGAEWQDAGLGRKTLYMEGLAVASEFPGGILTETMPGRAAGDGWLPRWSTDLSTTWKLVEHFDPTDLSLEKSGGNYTISNVTCEGTAQSVEMAICRWALAMALLKN